MNILFLTNLLPYPLDNGGKIKTFTTLRALKDVGHYIDLYCFSEDSFSENQSPIHEMCRNVKMIPLKLTSAENKKYMIKIAFCSLFSILPFSVYKYKSTEMENCLRALSEEKYDIIYYDHLQMTIYSPLLSAIFPNAKQVLDEHNCESLIVERKAESAKNLLYKLFLFVECQKYKRYEKKAILAMNKCIILSVEDYDALKKICGCDFEHSIIPIGVNDNGIKKTTESSGINILFLGTLTWEPNDHGITWFVNEVFPKIVQEHPDIKLYIVGKNPSNALRYAAEAFKNIFITGYVTSVDPYYDMCDFMIVPLFIGSGQRVKIIEAFSKGMPVLSTKIGAEGLNITDEINILIADTRDDFINKINELKNTDVRTRLAANGRKLYEQEYSVASIYKRINKAINYI